MDNFKFWWDTIGHYSKYDMDFVSESLCFDAYKYGYEGSDYYQTLDSLIEKYKIGESDINVIKITHAYFEGKIQKAYENNRVRCSNN